MSKRQSGFIRTTKTKATTAGQRAYDVCSAAVLAVDRQLGHEICWSALRGRKECGLTIEEFQQATKLLRDAEVVLKRIASREDGHFRVETRRHEREERAEVRSHSIAP